MGRDRTDPVVCCPYNKCHAVKESKLHIHLIKCEKLHPGWATCPYKATHRLPPDQIEEHCLGCPANPNRSMDRNHKNS